MKTTFCVAICLCLLFSPSLWAEMSTEVRIIGYDIHDPMSAQEIEYNADFNTND